MQQHLSSLSSYSLSSDCVRHFAVSLFRTAAQTDHLLMQCQFHGSQKGFHCVRFGEIKYREYLLWRKPEPGPEAIRGLDDSYVADHCM